MEGIVINAGACGSIGPEQIAQEAGGSPTLVMSQKAITDYVSSMAIGGAVRIDIPTFDEPLTYTGAEQTPEFTGYFEEYIEINGQTSATDAGEYTVTFIPKQGYVWPDGTKSVVPVKWRIEKAPGVCGLSLAIVGVIKGSSSSVTVSRMENAAVTAESADESIAQVLVSGNVVTISGKTKTSTTITVRTAETANYLAASASLEVRVCESVKIPAQANALTYNEETQSPDWTGYDTSKMTLSGELSASIPGEYEALFTLKDGFCWPDGSLLPKTVAWRIEKLSGSLTLSENNISLINGNLTGYVDVMREGSGTITAVSSDMSVATASVSGNRISIVGKKKGLATITVSVGEDTYYAAPVSKKISVHVVILSSTLSENTWDDIQTAIDAGQAKNLWAVGDTIPVHIEGTVAGQALNLDLENVILHLDYLPDIVSGGQSNIIWGLGWHDASGNKVALCDSKVHGTVLKDGNGFCMNPGDSTNNNGGNVGGWKDSYMRSVVMSQLLNAIPADLQNVIAAATIYSDNEGNSNSSVASAVTATSDKLWLPNEMEVNGTKSLCNVVEGNYSSQFSYFKSGNVRIANNANNAIQKVAWWLRSIRRESVAFFLDVVTDGTLGHYYACYTYGVRACFMTSVSPKTVGQLPVGATIVDPETTYLCAPIVWDVMDHDHDGEGTTSLCSDRILTLKCFDAAEPNNSNAGRQKYGNNRYAHSNILQWLNSDKENWYTAQHAQDQAPDAAHTEHNPYKEETGFLANFSDSFKNALQSVAHVTVRNTVTDGGGSESVTSRIYLLSATELGFSNESDIAEGSCYPFFQTSTNRLANPTAQAKAQVDIINSNIVENMPWWYWLRTPYSVYAYSERVIGTNGKLEQMHPNKAEFGVRPACVIPSDVKITGRDADGNYIIDPKKTVGDLPAGARIVDPNTRYYDAPIEWTVLEHDHHGKGETDLISTNLLCLKPFDAAEPTNTDTNRQSYGNNNYKLSNLLQWLNSDKVAGKWFAKTHTADQSPDSTYVSYNPYSQEAGFLAGFSKDFQDKLIKKSHVTAKTSVDGNGQETVESLIFLLSATEAGLGDPCNNVKEGTPYGLFTSNESRQAKLTAQAVANSDYTNSSFNVNSNWHYWMRTPAPSQLNSSLVYYVFTSGTLNKNGACNGIYGARPACIIPSTMRVSPVPNADGAYDLIYEMSLADCKVGDIVKLKEDGELREFIVVQIGNPNPTMYESGFDDAVILMRKNYFGNQGNVWDGTSSSYNNDYEQSDIDAWLNGEYYGKLDASVQNAVALVKWPYWKGVGTNSSGNPRTGANGLRRKIVLPSAAELGMTKAACQADSNYVEWVSYMHDDGAKVSYFNTGAAADTKRKATFDNGGSVVGWTRSPYLPYAGVALGVNPEGSLLYTYTYGSFGARPQFCLPKSAGIHIDGTVSV